MSRSCTVCTRDRLDEIDEALAAGASMRALAVSCGLSARALVRHKDGAHQPGPVPRRARSAPCGRSIDRPGRDHLCCCCLDVSAGPTGHGCEQLTSRCLNGRGSDAGVALDLFDLGPQLGVAEDALASVVEHVAEVIAGQG